MTAANWIAIGAVALTFLLNGGGWLFALARWTAATKATEEDVTALSRRVDVLEKDMREVVEMKLALKSHAELTNARFDSVTRQAQDGFERVAGEIRAFDRLVTTRLDEITNRLRSPA